MSPKAVKANANIVWMLKQHTIAQTKGIVSFAEANEISNAPKQSDYTGLYCRTVGGQ